MARTANIAFLVFFALYTAGVIIWLLAGLPPVVANSAPAVHKTLHRWGAGDRGYIVATKDGLRQRAAARSRTVPARELAVRAGAPVVIRFENDDDGNPHNVAIFRRDGERLVSGPIIVGSKATEETTFTFTAPDPGEYLFWDEFRPRPAQPAELVSVQPGHEAPAWARWIPGLRAAAAGAAIDSHDVQPMGAFTLQYLFSALNIALGILLVRLRPRDLAARLLALGMVGTAAVFNYQAHSGLEMMPGLALKLHDNYHLFAGLAYVYALLVFPDGRLATSWTGPRWFRRLLLAFYLAAITVVLVVLVRPRLHGDPTGFILFFGILIPVAGITSQAVRLRQASSAAQREQSRLLVWALGLALATTLVLLAILLAISGVGLDHAAVGQLDDLASLVFPVLFAAIPVTLTVVLVRYRLWDIDRVINQTMVYGTLTGVLGLAYLASVVVLQDLLDPITSHSDLVLVGSTLAVAALFRPARDRIQALIDRRFYRSRYDAARTLEVFSALGGVSMYFPRPVRDSNNGRNESGLDVRRAGCRRLDGDQALALARSRYFQYQDTAGRWHGDPGTDLGRIRRQQTMLRALAAKAVGRNLANPLRANALVGSVVRSLTKDDRLSLRRAVSLARQFRSFDPSRLTSLTLPVDRAVQRGGVVRRAGEAGFDAGLRQGWEQILLPRQPDADAAVAKLLARPTRPGPRAPPATTAPSPAKVPAPSKVTVTVRNGTPRQGLAARATTALDRLGFNASNGGNAAPAARTTLFHAPGADAAARGAARALKGGVRVARASRAGLAAGEVVLVLGADFRGVVGRLPAATTRPPAKPPKPTAATRDLPPWDPRPC